ncbi:MAG TPA: PAS domain S-box protein [Burkholderiaceae bacterium]|nr:PAS domain S-box protein [Burkholderiaceae bacterium]
MKHRPHTSRADPSTSPKDPTSPALDPRHEAEARIASLLGRPSSVADTESMERLVHELGVHQVEIEMQNEELRQAQAALEASRDRYVNLYEQAPVGYVTFGLDSVVVTANRLAAALAAVAASEMTGRRLTDFVALEDQPRLQHHLTRLVRGDGQQLLELRLASPRAEARWVALQMTLVADEKGRPQCRAALIDIGERVRMQEGVARLAAIVSSSEDAIISRDPAGVVTSWNGAAGRMFGCDDMLGQTMDRMVPASRRAEEAELLQRLRNGEKIAHLESERLGRSGVLLPISLSLSPIRDERGRVIGSAMIARDISERRRADRALHQRLRQLDVLSHAGQALIMGDNGGASLRPGLFARLRAAIGCEIHLDYAVSDAAEHLTLLNSHGLNDAQRAELAQAHAGDSLCGVAARQRRHLVVSHLGSTDWPPARRLKAAGARCYAGFPLLTQGRVYGVASFASTTQDRFAESDLQVMQTVCDQVAAMLERGRLLEELRVSEQSLKRADRAKDDFIATLAHELRNPLAPIRNALGVMRASDLSDPEQLRWCRDVIERQVTQMSHLLEDLLDVSRLTRNKVELRRDRIELRQAIDQALETTQPLIESQGHRLLLDLPEQPIVLQGDLTRLTQVFANLLNNAAKYTNAGGQIELQVRAEGGNVRISVRDSGIGIEAQQLPRVFDMFAQLAPALERSGGGLGIGLALTRGLVELHGGSMEAHSAGIGLGSEFVVILPTVPAAPGAAQPAQPAQPALPALPPRRLLVADDNVDAAASLAMLLGQHGQEVRTAFSGLEALRMAEDWHPDAAVLDIGMHDMNGYELCRRLRAQSWSRNLLLIACTGWGQDSDRELAREAGFDHHLVKPVDSETMLRLLSEPLPPR